MLTHSSCYPAAGTQTVSPNLLGVALIQILIYGPIDWSSVYGSSVPLAASISFLEPSFFVV